MRCVQLRPPQTGIVRRGTWPALALSRLDYTDYSLTRPRFCLYTRPRRTYLETVATTARGDILAERLRAHLPIDSPRVVFRCSTLARMLNAQ
jgi:hypothetical protein